MPKTPKNKIKPDLTQSLVREVEPFYSLNQLTDLESMEHIASEEIVKQHWLRQFKIWDSEEQPPSFFDEVKP